MITPMQNIEILAIVAGMVTAAYWAGIFTDRWVQKYAADCKKKLQVNTE